MKRILTVALLVLGTVLVLAPASAATTPATGCQPTISAAQQLARTGSYSPAMAPQLGKADSALVAEILAHPNARHVLALSRQACLSWRVSFGTCLGLDVTPVPCDEAIWKVTGVQSPTVAGAARCATGMTQAMRGAKAVYCLYPLWEGR